MNKNRIDVIMELLFVLDMKDHWTKEDFDYYDKLMTELKQLKAEMRKDNESKVAD